MHVLLQKEKRSFESQIADQAVKIQCLEAADKVMKEEVTKMAARIRELELEEIRRTEETNTRIRELEAEVAESAERSAAAERETAVARGQCTTYREELAAAERETAASREECAACREELATAQSELVGVRSSVEEAVDEGVAEQVSSFMDEMKKRYPDVDLSWVLGGNKITFHSLTFIH